MLASRSRRIRAPRPSRPCTGRRATSPGRAGRTWNRSLVIELQPHDAVRIAGRRKLAHRRVAVPPRSTVSLPSETSATRRSSTGSGESGLHGFFMSAWHRDRHRNAGHRHRPVAISFRSPSMHRHLDPVVRKPAFGSGVGLHAQRACGSMSGVVRSPAMYRCGTGSSQTVCQIPLTGVYQIPPGADVCLPRGCSPRSVGSQTRTFSVFFFLVQRCRHVERERSIAARVAAYLHVVDPDVGFPVYGAEVRAVSARRSSRSGRRTCGRTTARFRLRAACLRPTGSTRRRTVRKIWPS